MHQSRPGAGSQTQEAGCHSPRPPGKINTDKDGTLHCEDALIGRAPRVLWEPRPILA